jgi:hypothetical protein
MGAGRAEIVPALAERLANIDVRGFMSSIPDCARIFSALSGKPCEENPQTAQQRAFEPFYFCQAVEITVPLPWDAHTLAGFRAGLERLSHASFYHHFISFAATFYNCATNDFFALVRHGTRTGTAGCANQSD